MYSNFLVLPELQNLLGGLEHPYLLCMYLIFQHKIEEFCKTICGPIFKACYFFFMSLYPFLFFLKSTLIVLAILVDVVEVCL